MKILFVCTENLSRSPMAEIYFRHLCKQNKLEGVTCASAGIKVADKSTSPEEAKTVMTSLGLSLAEHRPRQISEEIVNSSDHIIVMDSSQAAYITENFTSFSQDNIKLMLSGLGVEEGIDDPYSDDLEAFQECFLTMMPAIANLADRVMRSIH